MTCFEGLTGLSHSTNACQISLLFLITYLSTQKPHQQLVEYIPLEASHPSKLYCPKAPGSYLVTKEAAYSNAAWGNWNLGILWQPLFLTARLWLLELRPTPFLACSCPRTVPGQAPGVTSSGTKVTALLVHICTLSLFPRVEMGKLSSGVPG